MFKVRKAKKGLDPNYKDYLMFTRRAEREGTTMGRDYELECASKCLAAVDWNRVPEGLWPLEVAQARAAEKEARKYRKGRWDRDEEDDGYSGEVKPSRAA
jgi:hypothetical protein